VSNVRDMDFMFEKATNFDISNAPWFRNFD